MLPDGITECRHCGQPCHGVGGGTCEHCWPLDILADYPGYLAGERRDLADVTARIVAARQAWENENADLLDEQRVLKASVAELEAGLREAALVIHARTGETKPGPGVMVKQYTVYHYSDADALEWAKSKGICLRHDRTAFERQAKALVGTPDQPSWLTAESEPRATIASNLDAALGSELDGGQS